MRDILYPKKDAEPATDKLKQTAFTQPALFVVEYALAQLWMSWGINPQAMIGHSREHGRMVSHQAEHFKRVGSGCRAETAKPGAARGTRTSPERLLRLGGKPPQSLTHHPSQLRGEAHPGALKAWLGSAGPARPLHARERGDPVRAR